MRLKALACCSASVAALTVFAAPAWAQTQEPVAADQSAPADPGAPETDETTVEEVVVTGIRRSLQSAQNIRRNSDEIVDAVVAEDIGKLPDLNTAQTAARIPGVQVYRQGGEAQNVLVRGLPNFTTTYNGREIFTAETRLVALQDFPSANIAALEVFKTSAADLVEPGLAGLVNIRSRRPFDFQDGQIAGSVWGLYTEQGDEISPNFNLLATKRWTLANGHEFGLLVNASRTDMFYTDAEISNTDFLQTFRLNGTTLAADPVAGTAARFPDIQRLFYRAGKRERPSVSAAAQYRPNPDLEFYADFLWQGFRNEIEDRLLAAELFNGANFSSLRVRPNSNLVASGTVNAPPGSLFTFQGATFNETDTYQYAAGFRYSPGPLTLNVELARTDTEFRGSTESLDRRWTRGPTINFDTTEPRFEITNINFADPSEQFFDGLYEENQLSTGDDWQFRTDLQYDVDQLPLVKNVQVGLRYTDRSAERRFGNRFGRSAALVNATALPVKFEVFNSVDFGGTTAWAAPTYDSIRDNIVALRQLAGFTAAVVPAFPIYKAEEQNLAGYGQVNLTFSENVEGTVGLRVVKVETKVAGPTPTGIPAIDEGSEDTSVLPNASIRARVSDTMQLRAAVSKTRTLPTFENLNPALNLGAPPPGGIGTPSNPYRATGGNPFLDPFTSVNLDVAAEFYLPGGGFVSVTAFRRQLDGFIQNNTFRLNDTPIGVIEITGPVNTGEGRIKGIELQGQAFADFDQLPDWARGFGVQANLTYLDAETQQPAGPGVAPLEFQPITGDPARRETPGVSEWQYNLVGIYERYGFSARLTYSGQSRFRATRQYRTGGGAGEFNDFYTEWAYPADRLDLSLNYEINDQFTLFGDWTNITDDTFRQTFTSARNGQPEAEFIRYRRYDESTISLGARFRFGR